MAPTITEHDVINAIVHGDICKPYQYHKSKHEKLRNVLCDTFALHGIQLDLSTVAKEKAFLPLILKLDKLVDKLKNARKNPKVSFWDSFPNKDKIFYSEAQYKDAIFIKVQEPDLEPR